MNSVEIVEDGGIVEFRGRGLTSGNPDATNIVTVDNTRAMDQVGTSVELSVPDNRVSLTFNNEIVEVVTIGIPGPAAQPIGEDAMLDNDSEIDFIDDNTWYIGYAQAGTLTSEPEWKIAKVAIITAEGDTSKKWANGSASYTKIWDDRLLYTY